MLHALAAAGLCMPVSAMAQVNPADLPGPTPELVGGPGGAERLLIHDDLTTEPIRLLSIVTNRDGTLVTYLDADEVLRYANADDLVAITHTDDLPFAIIGRNEWRQRFRGRPDMPHVVTLNTGERYVGRLALTDDGSEQLTLTHDPLGTFTVSLDDLARLTLGLRADAPVEGASTDDLVVFANDDTATGFVASIGSRVALETGDSVRTAPITSIREVRLANPPEPASGALVWLDDGSIIACDAFDTAGEERLILQATRRAQDPALTLPNDAGESGPNAVAGGSEGARAAAAVAARDAAVRLDEVAAVVFDAATARALATLDLTRVRADTSSGSQIGPTRDAPERALLFAAPIELPRPMSVRWALPEGAARFAARAELPEAFRRWGDPTLAVRIESTTGETVNLDRVALSADRPVAEINIELPSGASSLWIEVESGAHGAVQDAVTLYRAMVLIDADRIDG